MLHRRIPAVASAVMIGLVLAPAGVQAEPLDEAALPPWGLAAAEVPSGVELTWNAAVGGADAYRVYRADSLEAVMQDGWDAFAAIGGTNALSFVDEGGLDMDAVYAVTSVQDSGESLPSNPAMLQYPNCWNVTTPEDCFIPLP